MYWVDETLKIVLKILIFLLLLDVIGVAVFYVYAQSVDDGFQGSTDVGIVFHTENKSLLNRRMAKSVGMVLSGDIRHLKTVGGMRPLQGRIGAVDMAIKATMLGVPNTLVSADRTSNDTVTSLVGAASSIEDMEAKSVTYISECMHLVRVKSLKNRVDWKGIEHNYSCVEAGGYHAIWLQAHYEAIAWIVSFLPDTLHRRVVSKVRP